MSLCNCLEFFQFFPALAKGYPSKQAPDTPKSMVDANP